MIEEKIIFQNMTNEEKENYVCEREGYFKNGIGVNSNGDEFRDDNGESLFLEEKDNGSMV